MYQMSIGVVAMGGMIAGGCTEIDNNRLTIGDVDGRMNVELPAVSSSPALSQANGVSLTGMDRSNWEIGSFTVPVDEVHHHPTYTWSGLWDEGAAARQRGEHPNGISALTLSADESGQAAELFGAVAQAGWEVVLLPAGLMTYWVLDDHEPPRDRYQRSLANSGWRPETNDNPGEEFFRFAIIGIPSVLFSPVFGDEQSAE